MKYYRVTAKCGHVGRHSFILKDFYVKAASKKDAAHKIKITPRVKHDHKDAIREVEEINYEEYIKGFSIMQSDLYFHVHNSTEQRKLNIIKPNEIFRETKPIFSKLRCHMQRKKESIRLKEDTSIIKGGYEYEQEENW